MPRAPATPPELSDIELVDNVLRGAPAAVEAFFRRHSQLIYHCIRARADRQDVDDIFQAFFERLVKRVFHLTPRELLIKTRIEAASALLLESDRSIADIAFACGYCVHSAFTRQFKATVGVAPAQFRGSRRKCCERPHF